MGIKGEDLIQKYKETLTMKRLKKSMLLL